MSAIITLGLCIFPILFHCFQGFFFSENSVLIYGSFKSGFNTERVMMAPVLTLKYLKVRARVHFLEELKTRKKSYEIY